MILHNILGPGDIIHMSDKVSRKLAALSVLMVIENSINDTEMKFLKSHIFSFKLFQIFVMKTPVWK